MDGMPGADVTGRAVIFTGGFSPLDCFFVVGRGDTGTAVMRSGGRSVRGTSFVTSSLCSFVVFDCVVVRRDGRIVGTVGGCCVAAVSSFVVASPVVVASVDHRPVDLGVFVVGVVVSVVVVFLLVVVVGVVVVVVVVVVVLVVVFSH